jgi:hypothetical protein
MTVFSRPTPTHAVFFFLLYLLSILIRPTSANCYWPDGTDHNVATNASYPGSADEYYAPCNSDAKASMCCAMVQLGRATPILARAMGYASVRMVLGGEKAARTRVGVTQLA